ncbi:hypothetical protein [Rhodococcus globerulus]|uniref:hypothetical protein n=1 Tax=Rhodococcus globerulus TaxID=33008 RepID=UPI003018C658
MGGSDLAGAKIVTLITGSDEWVPVELVWGSYPHTSPGPARRSRRWLMQVWQQDL